MSGANGYQGFTDITTRGAEINALKSLIKSHLAEVATSAVVKVVAARSNGEVAPPGTIDVELVVHQVDGAQNTYPHGTIFNVPYSRAQNGMNGIIMDPKPGDVGVIVCASRDISAVKANKGDASPPGSLRRHDLADAIYIQTIIAKDAPSNYVQFTDDGMALVSPGTITIQAATIVLQGNVIQSGGTITSNGKHVDNTHTHGNVLPGSGSTSPPL